MESVTIHNTGQILHKGEETYMGYMKDGQPKSYLIKVVKFTTNSAGAVIVWAFDLGARKVKQFALAKIEEIG